MKNRKKKPTKPPPLKFTIERYNPIDSHGFVRDSEDSLWFFNPDNEEFRYANEHDWRNAESLLTEWRAGPKTVFENPRDVLQWLAKAKTSSGGTDPD